MCRPRGRPTPRSRSTRRSTAALALSLLSVAAPPARAEDVAAAPARDIRNAYLFRFEFDNDSFIGSDDAFSAGWSFQVHSPMEDTWHPGLATWIGRFPGLGDDGAGGRMVRWAAGIGQLIITPQDISISTPQPNDSPWAGILNAAVSWSAYDNRRMAALQFLLGCMGPCSGGESVQKFVHEDLGFGDPPQGWDNQLVNQVLANVNYEYRYKVAAAAPEKYLVPGRFANDFSFGGQVALGNFATYIAGEFEYRLGWGLPMGFTKTPDPIGLGIMLDPVYVDPLGPVRSPSAWRSYFTLMGRIAYINHLAPAEGGDTVNGGEHPELESIPGKYQALIGWHLARIPFAFHLTYYHYFEQEDIGVRSAGDWVNLSFEYRFGGHVAP